MKPQFQQGFLQPRALGRTSAPQRRQRGRGLGDSPEEGVGSALGANRGCGSMSRVHDGGIREYKQLPLDAADQCVEIPARQVGSPDGALEEDVATEYGPVPRKHDMPRRMARRMPDGELQATHRESFPR